MDPSVMNNVPGTSHYLASVTEVFDGKNEQEMSNGVLGVQFYSQPCHALAKALLGKILVRQFADGSIIKGKIVETEAYPGEGDRASHSFKGKTDRNAAMYEAPGTAYVYFIYGMYHCFNISALESGAAVLIRALEPLSGIQKIRNLRKSGADMKLHQLSNGPGRLCQAFDITTKVFNRHNLTKGREMWLEEDFHAKEIVTVEAKRIGIDSHGAEWAGKPWRYYSFGSQFVSKRDKSSEPAVLPSTSPPLTAVTCVETPVPNRKRKKLQRKEVL